ncbi:MAG: ATPase, partial [Sphaerospermopsis sp. SIO1G2]|nr:ATPase [Sphaerospermopsis sp. SIO1G2]
VKRDLKIYIQSKLIDNNHIMVRIGDNGLGIPKNIQAKLFDPFFTTKPVGKGTGLGLSISHQIIVEKHCGDIHCISNPGKGAEFIIKIPIKAVHKEHESLLCE